MTFWASSAGAASTRQVKPELAPLGGDSLVSSAAFAMSSFGARRADVVGLVDHDQYRAALLPPPPQVAQDRCGDGRLLLARWQRAQVNDDTANARSWIASSTEPASPGAHTVKRSMSRLLMRRPRRRTSGRSLPRARPASASTRSRAARPAPRTLHGPLSGRGGAGGLRSRIDLGRVQPQPSLSGAPAE